MRATLIPVAPNQPLLPLDVPQQLDWGCAAEHGPGSVAQGMGSWVLEMIEGTPGAPLYSMAFGHTGCSASTLFWIAHLQLHVNDRAAEMAGVPDVRGDALVVSNYGCHHAQSQLCETVVSQVSLSAFVDPSYDVIVPSPVGKVMFRIDTFKHGACLQKVRVEENVPFGATHEGTGRRKLGWWDNPFDEGEDGKSACQGHCCVVRPRNHHRVLYANRYNSGKPGGGHYYHLKKHASQRIFGPNSLRMSPRSVLNLQKKLRELSPSQALRRAGAVQRVESESDAAGSCEGELQTSTNSPLSSSHCTEGGLSDGDGRLRVHIETVQVSQEESPTSVLESEAFTDYKRLKSESSLNTPISEFFNGHHDIASLPGGVLQTIFGFLSFSDLSSCASVCHHWRQCLSDDQVTLSSLPIRYRSVASHMKTPPRAHIWLSRTELQIPFVLQCAAEAGNLSAIVLVGQELEIRGEKGKALTWYKQAARKGHQASQYKLGESYYRGIHGWQRDCGEALKWLQRAAKHPTPDNSICGAAAMVLGYIYLDGEGLDGADNSKAVKWFKVARDHGCMEAEKTVGWLWNTGQY